jgi:hypothetical protein
VSKFRIPQFQTNFQAMIILSFRKLIKISGFQKLQVDLTNFLGGYNIVSREISLEIKIDKQD